MLDYNKGAMLYFCRKKVEQAYRELDSIPLEDMALATHVYRKACKRSFGV